MTALMLAQPIADDGALALRAKGGDRAAFAELVARRYDFIHRLAWRWTGNRADADDMAQDVCIRLGKAIATWRGDSAFSTWLYALALNVARDRARSAARRAMHIKAFGEDRSVARGEGEADPAERLWTAVRQLPDKQRQAVTLVHGEGLSHGEAAEAMDCAEATVSWHIHEAKKRLKVLMTDARDE